MHYKLICIVPLALLGMAVLFAQQNKPQSGTEVSPPKVSVSELPPEPIPPAICKQSYSGYLEIAKHRKVKDTNLTSQQIGNYVKQRLSEGYILSLYPQTSGRLFVIESCSAHN